MEVGPLPLLGILGFPKSWGGTGLKAPELGVWGPG